MDLQIAKATFKNLRDRTLCFLIKDGQVLLGLKKSGFGQGKIVGIGGKAETGETIEGATIREMVEEVNATPKSLEKVAELNFYFPTVEMPDKWNQRVHVYTTGAWDGEISESEEIQPEWFNVEEVPFDLMWDDAKYWLKDVLHGKKVLGSFTFNNELGVLEWEVDYKEYF